MNRIQRPLSSRGAIVPITLGVPLPVQQALRQQGRPVISDIQVLGLLDTGASRTTINPFIAAQLQLLPIGAGTMITATTVTTVNTYRLDLNLSGFGIGTVLVCEAIQSFVGFDCLIGRDILDSAVFTYDGPGTQFTLTF